MAKKKSKNVEEKPNAAVGYIGKLVSATSEKPTEPVSLEIFRHGMTVVVDMLRVLNADLQEVRDRKECVFQFKFGDAEMTISGSETNKEFYAERAENIVSKMMGNPSLKNKAAGKSRSDKNEQDRMYN